MTLWPKGTEPLRIEYFLSRLFASQDIRGGEFSQLKRSYQISILGDNLYKDNQAVHWFEYYDRERGIALGGRTAALTLELRKLEALAERPLEGTSGQERWGLFLRYAAEPERLSLVNRLLELEEGIAMAGETILELPRSQIEEMRRISRDKYLMDQAQAEYDLRCTQQELDTVTQKLDAVTQERDAALRELAELKKQLGK
jgi:hypothetical protein